MIFVFLLATGCGGRFDTLRPVDLGPLMNKPGRLTEAHLLADVEGGTLAAVVVNFQGQNLKAESARMDIGKPFKGTMQDIVMKDNEPYKYHLFEVKNQAGPVLGYLLVRDGRLVGQYLEKDTVFLQGREPRLP
jgi:hypothetical protein